MNGAYRKVLGLFLLGLWIAFGCSRENMREQASATTPLTNAAPIDLNAAISQAKSQNKLVLLDFTGSDWCPPCMQLHKEIFSQDQFQSYANSNLVFVTVDFPSKYHLPEAASATNDLLSAKFNIEGFPTLVALDGEGKEIWRHLGFIDGGPKELAKQLDSAKAKAP